jgi:hypothetical protein
LVQVEQVTQTVITQYFLQLHQLLVVEVVTTQAVIHQLQAVLVAVVALTTMEQPVQLIKVALVVTQKAAVVAHLSLVTLEFLTVMAAMVLLL